MRGFVIAGVLLAVVAPILGGCERSYEQQTEKLYRFAKNNRIGSSPDYYLVKASGMAGPDRVALVFGMGEDFTFCSELAALYMDKYPADSYTCEMANN